MRNCVLVFLGGGTGAILRELLMAMVGDIGNGFPLDIFVANVVASFLLGLAFSLHRRGSLSNSGYLLIGTGVMGGLSTFSSFVLAAVQLMEQSPMPASVGALYIVLSLIVGYCAVLLGLKLGEGRAGV